MPFTVPFCTITSFSFLYGGNDNVADGSITNPYQLVISPMDAVLYPITKADFKIPNALPTNFGAITYHTLQGHPEIETVEFIQNGNDVVVEITLVSSFAMNDLNQIINICIDGAPSISSTVTGTVFNVTSTI